MEIWEEKYYSEEYGLETDASFRYFRRIISEFKPPFNLRTCAIKFVDEELEQKGITIVSDDQYNRITTDLQTKYISKSKYDKKIDSRHRTLKTYSSKFAYQLRFGKYYDYFINETQQNKLVMLSDWENGEFPLALQRPKVHNDTLQKIHNSDELDDFEKSKAEAENQKSYKESIDAIYNMAYGGKKQYETKQSGELKLNHSVNKSIGELEEEYEDYFNELKQDLEGDTQGVTNEDNSE